MSTLYSILLGIDVLLAIGVIALVLLQHGKGADAGAAFGSGASSTVFGSRGSASFLTRATAVLAAGFFINSLALAYLARQTPTVDSVMERVVVEPEPQSAPPDVTMEPATQGTAAQDLPPDQAESTADRSGPDSEPIEQDTGTSQREDVPTQPKARSVPDDVPQ